jgi:hypothetical protein
MSFSFFRNPGERTLVLSFVFRLVGFQQRSVTDSTAQFSEFRKKTKKEHSFDVQKVNTEAPPKLF